ncbi:phosphotriesterase family protein [Ruania alba]|uniref:Phosphotriesterase-related protein n=1 Tax=Ruania alba TaxID=648782 RepID=A0A1H5DLN0_9MICO|nr:aryldialkylphosphatase [Ruania alba]SED79815.1 phosphotriesterase-related protein [Ruania alba]
MTNGTAGTIRTVLGDVDPATLGATNTHEHLFQVSPLLPGDDLDDPELSQAEAADLVESGFTAMIDATPIGLGRRPADVARISAAVGLTVVASTGVHREAHYPAGHPMHTVSVAKRTALFRRDLTEAMPISDDVTHPTERAVGPQGADVRAGLIKCGIGYWSISGFERSTLEAAGEVHRETGAPVMVHLEHCTAAHELLDLLVRCGVAPYRVMLAHADRLLDPGLHVELIARGAYLGYDGAARARNHSDAALIDLTEAVLAAGGTRIVLGADVARASRYLAYGGMPGLAYLGRRYLPRLEARIGADAVHQILVQNPRELLTWAH